MDLPQIPNPTLPQQIPKIPLKKPPTKLPKPQELITHYESQGLNTQEASIKVINDLQQVLFQLVTSRKSKKHKFMVDISKKLDNVNARLALVESKLDTKPGLGAGFSVGLASVTAFNGIVSVWPHVASAALTVWNSVRGSSNT